MENQYTITVENRITTIRFFVNPTYDLVVKILDELAERDIHERRLWDFSEIYFDWSMKQIQSIAEYGKKVFTKPNKLALFATKDLSFGVLRQFEMFREEENRSSAMVFRNEAEATAWLNQ